MSISRRSLIGSLGALGACATAPSKLELGASPQKLGDLFTLGVASGDPNADGFVIWTRLAPEPLAPDGGLSAPVEVVWQVAEDAAFAHIVAQGRKTASAQLAHSIHVEVGGLKVHRPYYYRFIADGQNSPTGRARTTPYLGAMTDQLRFGFVSCQHFEQGFFTPYLGLVDDDPELIIHLGDYIYESTWGPQVRRHPNPESFTLADYRQLHAAYKTDKALQAAHAYAPWLMIWDDHEVVNDYAGTHGEKGIFNPTFLDRRKAAYQAYYEHMPVRLKRKPHGLEMHMYDYFYYGDLMTMALTDGRQYRTDQACQTPEHRGAGLVRCAELNDPKRTMFGPAQERWLMSSLGRTGAIWEVLAQVTLFSKLFQKDRNGIPGSWNDGWDGYPGTRKKILDAIARRKPKNFVAIGGDMHSWWQADLKEDYNNPASRTLGAEFVTTSITSHSYAYNRFKRMLPDNPHIHFFDDRKRGYCLVNANRNQWRVDMKEVNTVYQPSSVSEIRKSFVVENGNPKAHEI